MQFIIMQIDFFCVGVLINVSLLFVTVLSFVLDTILNSNQLF